MTRQKSTWLYCFLIIFLLSTVSKRNNLLAHEQDVDKYLKQQQEMVGKSINTMRSHKLNIIPSPKKMVITDKIRILCGHDPKAILVVDNSEKSRLSAEIINRKIRELSGVKLPVKSSLDITAKDEKIFHLIILGNPPKNILVPGNNPNFDNLTTARDEAYCITTTEKENGKTVISLSGKSHQGTLYAAITFSQVLFQEGNEIFAWQTHIEDWPDFKYRCMGGLEYAFRNRFWWNNSKDALEGKKYIDWALQHKINYIWGVSVDDPYQAIGDPRFRTSEQRKWLKEVNDYAYERGIKVVLPQNWHIGVSRYDKNKPEYKDCIEHRGGLFCWSRDELLEKKANELADFIEKTGYRGIYFHCIDTKNERWEDRCNECRFRFGNDRAAADANVINHLYGPLREKFPDLFMAHVIYPYHGDLSKLENEKEREFFARLGTLIPEDVYICRREGERRHILSYKNALRQPIFIYSEGFWSRESIGRPFFVSNFRNNKVFYLNNEDALFYSVAWPQHDIMVLGGAEYSWNVNSPGASFYEGNINEHPRGDEYRRNVWFNMGREPAAIRDFILRACENLYGRGAAPAFAGIFQSGLNSEYILNYKSVLAQLKEIGIPEKDAAGLMEQQYKQSVEVLDSMKSTFSLIQDSQLTINSDYKDRYADFIYYLTQMYEVNAGAEAMHRLLMAQEYLDRQKEDAAESEISTGLQRLEAIKKELKKAHQYLESKTRIYGTWTLIGIYRRLSEIEDMFNLLKARISLRGQKSVAVSDIIELPKTGKLKVAIYNANQDGGESFGQNALLQTLQKQVDMDAEFISDLSIENLRNYECLLFPDTKKMGKNASNIVENIRKYVIEYGGGVLFQHDSVGFHRFPLGGSLFPGICGGAKARVGCNPRQPGYSESDRELTVVSEHPVTEGFYCGEKRIHSYHDHISLKDGQNGQVLIKNRFGDPVVIAGEIGKGRVIFDGTINYNVNDEELAEASCMEKDTLLNGIYWLSGREHFIRISNKQRNDRVMPDGTFSYLSFTIEVVPDSPLSNVFVSCRVYNAENMRVLEDSRLLELSKLKEKWVGNVAMKVTEVSKIRMEILLDSVEGTAERKVVF